MTADLSRPESHPTELSASRARTAPGGHVPRPRGSALTRARAGAAGAGLAALRAAVRGHRDPEQAITAALRALGTTDPEDDTCLVALRVL
jgi:hypothetical protein